MSKLMRCDRCGKEIPWAGNGPLCVLQNLFTNNHYDLCDECFKLVDNFVKKDGVKSAES